MGISADELSAVTNYVCDHVMEFNAFPVEFEDEHGDVWDSEEILWSLDTKLRELLYKFIDMNEPG